MAISCRYVHTNIVARDWKRLATFYEEVFGCRRVPPPRDYQGAWVTDVTALEDVSLAGMHLRLPGYGEQGPTLEIFQYNRTADADLPPAANRKGFAHIAFHVDDVEQAKAAVLAAGGCELGQQHSMQVPGAGEITLIYMTDPEGNIVELQRWSG